MQQAFEQNMHDWNILIVCSEKKSEVLGFGDRHPPSSGCVIQQDPQVVHITHKTQPDKGVFGLQPSASETKF
jgi:hypothetical protein